MRLEADPMRRRGFALVAALVVLVLLGSMGALMVRVTGVEQVGTSLSLLGVRADLAARSGLEWAVHRVVIDGDCPAPTTTLPLGEGALTGFRVVVACAATTHVEGTVERRSLEVRAEASFGSPGTLESVYREIHVALVR